MNESLKRQLLNSKLFKNVSIADLSRLDDELFNRQNFQPGEIVVQQGRPANYMYLIVNGMVKISKRVHDGQEIEIITRGTGDFIGEMGLIEGKEHSSSVVCKTRVVIITIKKDDFFTIIRTVPEVHLNITRLIATRMRDSLNQTGAEISRNKMLSQLNKQLQAQIKTLEKRVQELTAKN